MKRAVNEAASLSAKKFVGTWKCLHEIAHPAYILAENPLRILVERVCDQCKKLFPNAELSFAT